MLKSIPLSLMRVTKPLEMGRGVFNPAPRLCGFMSFSVPFCLVLPAESFLFSVVFPTAD